MPGRVPLLEADANRKRKAHRKSRQGCGNCKLRRVKCDETRPKCKKCIAYGVSCNYNSKSEDLEIAGSGSFSVIEMPKKVPSFNQTILNMMNAASTTAQSPDSPPDSSVYRLNSQDLELLHKFQTRTSFTIGTEKGSVIFRQEMFNISFSHPFLLHVILTLTLRHDRFLSASPSTKPTTAEAYHWYQGTALFNSALSKPVKHSQKDALWATAAILGAIAFSCLETSGPEEAWPLKPRSTSDLDWLKMSDGKKAVFKLADPLRPDSVFRPMHTEHWNQLVPSDKLDREYQTLPPEFVEIFELWRVPTESNPYHEACSLLSQLMELECNHKTILEFLSFIGQIHPDLRRLFEEKEPRALLLLAYWFAKLCQYHQWWIWRRSILECQAICIYLERYHGHESDIIRLLSYPKTMCGLFDR